MEVEVEVEVKEEEEEDELPPPPPPIGPPPKRGNPQGPPPGPARLSQQVYGGGRHVSVPAARPPERPGHMSSPVGAERELVSPVYDCPDDIMWLGLQMI